MLIVWGIHLLVHSLICLLAQAVADILAGGTPHADFRLVVTTGTAAVLPDALLAHGTLCMAPAPKGIRQRVTAHYKQIGEDQFGGLRSAEWRSALFAAALFMALIRERSGYGAAAIPMTASQIRPATCHGDFDLLLQFVRERVERDEARKGAAVPWDALRYMTSEVLTGGLVTDAVGQAMLRRFAAFVMDREVMQPGI